MELELTISATDFSLLLFRISHLPAEEADELHRNLADCYYRHLDKCSQLLEIKRAFEAVANCIKSRVPLSDEDTQLSCTRILIDV